MGTLITRRGLFGLAGVFAAAWQLSWLGQKASAVSTLRRRFHRWRTGMQPRWVEWSSTNRWDEVVSPNYPFGFKYTDAWRELRWPDNDELVTRTVCSTAVEPLEPEKLPPHFTMGSRSADRIEMAAAVYRSTWLDGQASPPGDPDQHDAYLWFQACYLTVSRWRRDAQPLTALEIEMYQAALDCEDPASLKDAHWFRG